VNRDQIGLRTLFIEEEGELQNFSERCQLVLRGTGWEEQCVWLHHSGIRLDDQSWIEKLSDYITKYQPDVVFLDPFARTFGVDEDSSTEMGKVFRSLSYLMMKHRHISIVILHHTTKHSVIGQRWGCLRGSSKIGAEADLGIFCERRVHGKGINVIIDGRDIVSPQMTNGSGS